MRRLGIVLVLTVLAVIGPAAAADDRLSYPPTRVDDVVENLHGTEVHDPYRWLEDGTSAEVQQWAKDQNTFARQQLDRLPGRAGLAKRLQEVSYVDAVGVPRRAGSRLFFTRRKADQEKAVLYWRGDVDPGGRGVSPRSGRREPPRSADHVLVDPNALSKDGSTSLGEWVPSHDGRTLAYALRENNADEATLYVKDVLTGRVSERDRIEGAKYASPAWTPAGDGFYYTWLPTDPKIPVAERPGRAEIVPEAADAVLQDTAVIGGRLALSYLRNAASEIELRTLDGKKVRSIKLPGLGSSSGLIGNPAEDEAFYDFSSFTHPPEIWRTSIATGGTRRWAKRDVPVDPKPYTVEQVFYVSKDGTKVPMFLVHRKDAPKDGSTPFLLYGYGGFNVNVEPSFSARLYPWLEAGGGYAVANLRGGGEYGEDWHKAGSLANKQNVFDDFIAAGEYLVKDGWTKPERFAIQGGSNGGLLVGAALTQRPDLFKAVICEVPLLDMVRYHRFGSGRTWVSEYGSADNKEDFGWLYAYSPYHQVQSGTAYPAVLLATSDSDDRVDPLHARKMAARLQAASTGGPVLLRVEANAGHGGADKVSSAVAKAVDAYAFLFNQLGMG